jgi:hypothetical protein
MYGVRTFFLNLSLSQSLQDFTAVFAFRPDCMLIIGKYINVMSDKEKTYARTWNLVESFLGGRPPTRANLRPV